MAHSSRSPNKRRVPRTNLASNNKNMTNSFNNTTVNNTPNITTFYSHTVKYIINHIDNGATARGAKFPTTVICIIVVLQCHVIFSE